ncbi:sulfatase family protein [Labilibaculum antarcticum]|uniref:Sulfatase n=1 Tax=Labilibaculum antarcticum TaxID=1717717 RepID=A0A1Y1CG57_9BACT|nr:sulfatase [Labilibaculum antarcticum]BAX79315.1 sulfatase [Labilibaculum antarcticum]
MKLSISLLFLVLLASCSVKTTNKPNILWITSEDNSPLLGCYDDAFATTPNLDKLASEGFLYTHAYANAPVCAPARNTIISGVYANSAGNQHMRSYNNKSDSVRLYPDYLREAGYYCTNNRKTDYNINKQQTSELWDETSDKAHYKNRKPGQPFFAIFNIGVSHEVTIHRSRPSSELRHSPDSVPLPPYHPATEEMKHDWAQYYDQVENMDTKVGQFLAELEASGEADNTIVFYYSDHGGVLARSKRYVYETGTHVPFIVRIPEKFKHLFPESNTGSKVDRIISFVDLAPTLLSILNIPIPDFMQGNAFMGEQKTEDPQYAYMFRGRMDERYDMCRAVRDQKYRYIRNYMPYRSHGQHLTYLWNAPSARSWERAYKAGECNEIQSAFWKEKPFEELYDTENDPWEINNLANNSEYSETLIRMRAAVKDWSHNIHDAGFIPEGEMLSLTKQSAPYDLVRSANMPLDTIINVADIVTQGLVKNRDLCIAYLKNENSVIRYWGATGLLILKNEAAIAIPELKLVLNDDSPNVAIVAAETLYNLGEKELALKSLNTLVNHNVPEIRCQALNTVDCLGVDDETIKASTLQLIANSPKKEKKSEDLRMAEWLVQKWEL